MEVWQNKSESEATFFVHIWASSRESWEGLEVLFRVSCYYIQNYIISSVMHAFLLVLTYDLLEDRHIDDVIIKSFFCIF